MNVEQAYSEYQAGLSLKEVGRKHCVSAQTVLNHFSAHALSRRSSSEHKIKVPAYKYDNIAVMYRDGKTIEMIARELNVGGTTISTILKKTET